MNRLLPTWVLGELCHQWSCLPQLHDSLIPSQSQSLSWNARKVWEAVCSPGSLSLKCRNNLPTPPGPRPQNISHGFKSPSFFLPNSLLWQRVCDLSNPCLLFFQTNLFSKTSFSLSFSSFSLPLWWSRQGCSSPQSFKSCIASSSPQVLLSIFRNLHFSLSLFSFGCCSVANPQIQPQSNSENTFLLFI